MINILLFITVFLIPFYFIRFDILSIPTNIFEVAVLMLLIAIVINNLKFKNNNCNIKYFNLGDKTLSTLILLFFLSFLIGSFKAGFSLDSLGIVKSYFVVPLMFGLAISYKLSSYKGHTNLKPKTQNLNPVLVGLYASLMFVSVWAISQKFGIITTLFYQAGDVSFNQYLGSNFRAFGPFESPNYLAMFIVPVIFITIGTNLKFKIYNLKLWNIFFYLSLILPLIALFLTKSRAGIIALIVSLSLYGILWLYKKLKSKVAQVALALSSIILSLLFFILLLKFGLRPETDSIRLEIYSYSWQMIRDNPIFGIGLGNYQNYLSNMVTSDSFREIVLPYAYHPHSLFLAMWLNLGLIGLVSFIGLIIFFFINIIKYPSISNILFSCSIIAILAHGFFDTTYFKNDLSAFFWLAILLTVPFHSDKNLIKH